MLKSLLCKVLGKNTVRQQVVLASNDPRELEALGAYLDQMGMPSVAVADIGQMIGALRSGKPKALFIDARFGECSNAIPVVRELRADATLQKLPIIIIADKLCKGTSIRLQKQLEGTTTLRRPFSRRRIEGVLSG